MHVPLHVAGQVQARCADETVVLSAARDTITVDLPNVRTGLAALKGAGGRRRQAQAITRASGLLGMTDLTVRVRVAGATLAMLGASARPGVLSRLLGVRPLEVRLSWVLSLLKTLWR